MPTQKQFGLLNDVHTEAFRAYLGEGGYIGTWWAVGEQSHQIYKLVKDKLCKIKCQSVVVSYIMSNLIK